MERPAALLRAGPVALGHQLAAVPYLESIVLSSGALARFGSEELQGSWGSAAVRGEKILTVALDGEMGDGPVQSPCVFTVYLDSLDGVEAFRKFLQGDAVDPLRRDVARYTNCELEWTVCEVRDV